MIYATQKWHIYLQNYLKKTRTRSTYCLPNKRVTLYTSPFYSFVMFSSIFWDGIAEKTSVYFDESERERANKTVWNCKKKRFRKRKRSTFARFKRCWKGTISATGFLCHGPSARAFLLISLANVDFPLHANDLTLFRLCLRLRLTAAHNFTIWIYFIFTILSRMPN